LLPSSSMNNMVNMNEPTQMCNDKQGSLPSCAPLAVPYVPFQLEGSVKYNQKEGLENGTLFPGLNLPFHCATTPNPLPNTALAELMALEFAIGDLGLYLDTHPNDAEVLELYTKYVALEKEGRKRYVATYGPITQTDVAGAKEYTWLREPWPWELSERAVK
jgi:spore coat protein JB